MTAHRPIRKVNHSGDAFGGLGSRFAGSSVNRPPDVPPFFPPPRRPGVIGQAPADVGQDKAVVTPVAGFIHDPGIWIEVDFRRHVPDLHGKDPTHPPVAGAVEAEFELLKVTRVDVRIADRIGLQVTGEGR